MAEMPAMMERLIDLSFAATDDTREALIRLLKALVHEIETNEFVRVLLDDPSEVARLAEMLDFEDILQRSAGMFLPLMQEITKAQERGEIIPGDPQQIMYSLGLIKLIPLNRDRLPDALYQAMLDFIPQVIADGLTCPTRQRKEDG